MPKPKKRFRFTGIESEGNLDRFVKRGKREADDDDSSDEDDREYDEKMLKNEAEEEKEKKNEYVDLEELKAKKRKKGVVVKKGIKDFADDEPVPKLNRCFGCRNSIGSIVDMDEKAARLYRVFDIAIRIGTIDSACAETQVHQAELYVNENNDEKVWLRSAIKEHFLDHCMHAITRDRQTLEDYETMAAVMEKSLFVKNKDNPELVDWDEKKLKSLKDLRREIRKLSQQVTSEEAHEG